jgi:hypothetical protein
MLKLKLLTDNYYNLSYIMTQFFVKEQDCLTLFQGIPIDFGGIFDDFKFELLKFLLEMML